MEHPLSALDAAETRVITCPATRMTRCSFLARSSYFLWRLGATEAGVGSDIPFYQRDPAS